MDADLDTLATALYVRTDDLLKASPDRAPARPHVGFAPRLTDAELVTLAVMQALLGRTSEARWLRYARAQLRHLFPYLPQQPGYNKRLRALADTLRWLIGVLARDTRLWTDDVWVADSTPVECARSREAAHRSELAGWAEYGYCASHSRYFWGLRLHLVCTLHGLPVGFALSGAKADEREVLVIGTDGSWRSTPSHNRAADPMAGEVHDLGRRTEPDLPTVGPEPGAPVDALPVERVGLVLRADVDDSVTPNEIARLGPVTDPHLTVVRPTVPPEPLRRFGAHGATPMPPEHCLPKSW